MEQSKTLYCTKLEKITSVHHRHIEHKLRTDLGINVVYYNYTGNDISVVGRNGFPFTLPHRRTDLGVEPGFVVRTEIIVSRETREFLYDYISKATELTYIQKELKGFLVSSFEEETGKTALRFDMFISAKTIRDNGGTVYIEDLDIILTANKNNIPSLPPVDLGNTKVEVGNTNMVMIDNNNVIDEHYTFYAGEAIPIPIIKLPLSKNGLHLTFKDESGEIIKRYYSPDEFAKIPWLFKSKRDVVAPTEQVDNISSELGRVKVIDKRNNNTVAEQKERFEVVQLATDRIKAEHQLERDRLEIERNAILEQMKVIQADSDARNKKLEALYKLENIRVKDHYENRSYERKDQSEILKFVPAVLAGGIALFVGIKAIL